MRDPIGITSNATVVNRKGISHATALKIRVTVSRAPNKGEGLKQMTTMNKKSLYKRLVLSLKTAPRKNAPMKYWVIWQTKTKQSKMSSSKSSEMEGIF